MPNNKAIYIIAIIMLALFAMPAFAGSGGGKGKKKTSKAKSPDDGKYCRTHVEVRGLDGRRCMGSSQYAMIPIIYAYVLTDMGNGTRVVYFSFPQMEERATTECYAAETIEECLLRPINSEAEPFYVKEHTLEPAKPSKYRTKGKPRLSSPPDIP